MERAAAAQFEQHLDPRRHRLIGLATRTQGLMVKLGNPKAIASLADLARADVRIINRQQGSGSRIQFDQLLSGAGIAAESIDGYLNEEYTHLAVAATVAGGMADAGFGIKAAATQYELDFLPLLTERYYLACRADALAEPTVKEFLAALRGAAFREILAGLPGYGSGITGEVRAVDEALASGGPLRTVNRPAKTS
jgi:molybdate-binding protein